MDHEIHEVLAPKLLANILGSRQKESFLQLSVYWMEDCTYQEIISTQKSLNIQFWRKKKYRVKPVIDRNLSFIPIIQQFSIHFSVLTDSRHTTCSTNIQLHCSGKSTNIYDNLHETKWRTCESYYWRIVHAG